MNKNKTLTIMVPGDVESSLKIAGYNEERLTIEARQSLAASLFSQKVLTLGQAAQLAGMPIWEFIPYLGTKGIAVVDYDKDEIDNEAQMAKWLSKRQNK